MEAHQLQAHAVQIGHAVSALIELEAMKAENTARKKQGLSPAYGEKEFLDLLKLYGLGYNGVIEKSRDFF